MARTRRARRRNTWFPVVGTAGETPPDNINGRVFQIFAPDTGTTEIIIAPMVPDVPMEGDDIDPTAPGQLVQALGQEYILERLVGKFFACVNGNRPESGLPSAWANILLGLGFFVARANDSDVGGGADTPIGSATLAERQENYNPLGEDTIREPWIWRRTWVLGDPAMDFRPGYNFAVASNNPNQLYGIFPPSTAHYGSVMDGPHIDAKSNRRIGNDERLWVAVAVTGFQRAAFGDTYPISTSQQKQVSGYLDYRVLGRLVKAHNKSTF